MSTVRYLIGDVFDVMATMEPGSVDLVLTSPPFLALRSYLPEGHPDKDREIGSEATPAEFLDTMLALTAEWGRLLTPYGSIAVELGDTYSGSGGSGGDYAEGGLREGQGRFDGSASKAYGVGAAPRPQRGPKRSQFEDPKQKGRSAQGSGGPGWPLDKSMCGIPHLYHLSLAYGRNILTGEESPAGFWRVRNVVAWCRPNPAVGALGDKYRPATSYMTIATRARDRWFDLDAVRVPLKHPDQKATTGARSHEGDQRSLQPYHGAATSAGRPPYDHVGLLEDELDIFEDDAWLVSTEAYPGSHYATWPRRLLDRPIKAMCPLQVCTCCGEPRRRMTKSSRFGDGKPIPDGVSYAQAGVESHSARVPGSSITRGQPSYQSIVETLGWSECDCPEPVYRNGLVFDPFGGSGTTGVVASGLGRDCVLIDLDERNADLARERIGMFLQVPEVLAL